MTNKKHKDYEVGYCKPPKKNQFKPGHQEILRADPKTLVILPKLLLKNYQNILTLSKTVNE